MNGPILEVKGATKAFGGVRAVDEANLTAFTGIILGLIGPNGAGKSTLVNAISGFEPLDGGRVIFDEHRIDQLEAHKIARLGLVRTFQTSREWPELTVMENLLVCASSSRDESMVAAILSRPRVNRIERAKREQARELLAALGLFSLRNERAGSLSTGQRRLVEFARIEMRAPKMVVLDEPLAGVNPVLIERVSEFIRRMAANGLAVLVIEHNLPFVESICDSVVVMSLGKTIAQGTMEQLWADQAVVDAYLGEPANV